MGAHRPVGLSAAAGYILTRSLAMPGDADDRGNWLEPLGLASLIIELVIVILAVLAIASRRRAADGAAVPSARNATATV